MAYISTPVPLPVSQGGTGNVYGIPNALQIGNGYTAFLGCCQGQTAMWSPAMAPSGTPRQGAAVVAVQAMPMPGLSVRRS